MMLTLKDFAEQVIRPMVLRDIANGALDLAIADPDVLEVIGDDAEVMTAIAARNRVISES